MGSHSGNLVAVTGGPGSGKTSLIAELAARGLATMPEAGRAVIRDQDAIDGQAVPWRNRTLFAELMLAFDLRSYREAQARQGVIIFDRGIPDVAGYLGLCGLTIPPHLDRAIRQLRYRREVFIAPPWRAIYRTDGERRQDFEEARRTHLAIAQIYREYGYDLIDLPCVGVAERADFVARRIGLAVEGPVTEG